MSIGTGRMLLKNHLKKSLFL